MISQKTLKTLEFDKILLKLRQFCINEDTADFIMSHIPSTDYNEVQNLLNQTLEADRILHICLINPLEVFDNIDEVLKKAPRLSALSFLEILKTARFLRSSRIFKNSIASISDEKIKLFKEFADAVYIDQTLEKEITRCFLSDEEMSSDASKVLSAVRIKIRRCNENIKTKLNSIIKNEQKYLSDSIITIRQGRYVVPVKSESRSNIKGLIHDQSSSGATVFIEPMEVVELNNELRLLQTEEQREIDRIVLEFTREIGQICAFLSENLKILLNADLVFAKAKYAKSTRATMPVINSREISVKCARHPLIDPKVVVPIDLKIGNGYKILIITGPNTGGKTVTLKLCGLLCIMAMCGMFIPAEEQSAVCVFDNIFCDIGDEQSIEQSLSTFSSHIKNIAEVLNNLKGKTLILFDELGAGTDPKEGAALALSIVDYLNKNNVTALITTHYSELKEYSFVTEGIQNAGMDFNIDTYCPTYKLKIGIPGSSNAIEIARRLNLKEEIILNARSHLSEDKINFENVLKSAEKSRFEAEKTSEELESKKEELSRTLKELNIERQTLKNAKENLLNNSKTEAKKIVSKAAAEADEIISEIKRILNSPLSESSLLEARQLKNKLQ
ncbi:MAG: endonuclease MutS2, partial [Firmicutes bacterium]|nr:endonuclease MutS2 [Bacillota bacterium]